MSEDAFRASLVSLAMFEESIQAPFVNVGFPKIPMPASLLLSALKAEEEKEEEEVIEEVKEIRVVVPRFG